MEAVARGCGLKCLDGDLLFQASFLKVPEGDFCVFRRLIFQRFPLQDKDNTFTGISTAASQQASWKNGLYSQWSLWDRANSVPFDSAFRASVHGNLWGSDSPGEESV